MISRTGALFWFEMQNLVVIFQMTRMVLPQMVERYVLTKD